MNGVADLSYIASNDTGPISVPNPPATYNPLSYFTPLTFDSFKATPALPNTYRTSFPFLVVTKLNFPKAYTGICLILLESFSLTF